MLLRYDKQYKHLLKVKKKCFLFSKMRFFYNVVLLERIIFSDPDEYVIRRLYCLTFLHYIKL